MKYRPLFLLLIPMQFLLSEPIEKKFSEGVAPAWVRRCDFPLDPVSPSPTQVNLQYLLSDMQHNREEKTVYCHFSIKPLNPEGIREVAQVKAHFDPSYQTVVVHCIHVFRNGEWHDRMHTSRHDLLKREYGLENDTYNGNLTLVYFLDDIREGDILEWAYSIVGELPFFSSHYEDVFSLQTDVSIGRLYRRVVAHPDCKLTCKTFNTGMATQVVDLSPSLREWSWEVFETIPCPYENDRPAWYHPYAHVEISEYKTWREVVEKNYPLYALPKNIVSEEMAALVKEWMELSSDPEERALLALRFVQEKIRYFGFEQGLEGFKPRDPQSVLSRRFGDCKDKVYLLSVLLDLMDIRSTCVLVNSNRGKSLIDSLPTSFAFNHVILRIEIDGREYWVDPTLRRQGGSSLRDNHFPDYHWGLPITQDATGLYRNRLEAWAMSKPEWSIHRKYSDANAFTVTGPWKFSHQFNSKFLANCGITFLPALVQDKPIEIHSSFFLTSEDAADLKIVWTFHSFKADSARARVEEYGLKKITEDNLDRIQKMYGGATLLEPVSVIDDRKQNILTMTESYRVPTRRRPGKQVLKVFSFAIRKYLDEDINPERSSPYSLEYPCWIKEHIHIENPFFGLEAKSDRYTYEHESLRYSHSWEMSERNADLSFELQHLKDHVPTTSLREYWEVARDIDQDSAFNIKIADRSSSRLVLPPES